MVAFVPTCGSLRLCLCSLWLPSFLPTLPYGRPCVLYGCLCPHLCFPECVPVVPIVAFVPTYVFPSACLCFLWLPLVPTYVSLRACLCPPLLPWSLPTFPSGRARVPYGCLCPYLCFPKGVRMFCMAALVHTYVSLRACLCSKL
jgi:hypothetical protein